MGTAEADWMELHMHMLLSSLATPMVQFGVMGVAVAMIVTFLMRPSA